ncbi:MAG: type II secretion system F family protein [Thermoanaerobacteraceae bacterium]|nr:type II secretion system F family protein [Thermoanaerobacteraceae bacterium]
MTLYYYKGKSLNGEEIRGLLNSENKYSVARRIKSQGFIPVIIKEIKPNSLLYMITAFFKRASPKDLAVFCRQFGVMVDADVDVLESLNFIIKQVQNRRIHDILIDIIWQVKCGYSLADALRNHPYIFSEVFVSMIEAGEASGNLSDIFKMLSDYYSDIARRKEKIKNVMTYPCILGITSLVVVNFLTIKVLPIYANIFSSFGAKLPKFTLMLIWINSHLAQIFIISSVLLLISLSMLSHCRKSEKLAYRLDKLKLSIPFVGQLVKINASFRITRILYILITSGIPILKALEIATNTVKNRVIIRELEKIKIGLKQGKNLSDHLCDKVFPPIMAKMIAIGEESGTLEKMLDKVASIYESEVDFLQERLMTLVEPVIIVILTVIVSFIVISILMPMLEIYELF